MGDDRLVVEGSGPGIGQLGLDAPGMRRGRQHRCFQGIDIIRQGFGGIVHALDGITESLAPPQETASQGITRRRPAGRYAVSVAPRPTLPERANLVT